LIYLPAQYNATFQTHINFKRSNLCWALVFKTGLSNIGGAIAMSISIWLNVIFLGLYMRYSSACAKTRAPISMELFQGIWEFFRFAIPSAVMIW
jgi:MATE family multidrug resistance protein